MLQTWGSYRSHECHVEACSVTCASCEHHMGITRASCESHMIIETIDTFLPAAVRVSQRAGRLHGDCCERKTRVAVSRAEAMMAEL